MSAMNPVRELDPGARPRDWMDGPFSANDAPEQSNEGPAHARVQGVATSTRHAPAQAQGVATSTQHAPARTEPQRYKVQFEASEEYVELVERAKALLSHRTPRADLGELHLRAMRTLVAELERQRYAVTVGPRRRPACSTQPASIHEFKSDHESQAKPEHESEVLHESEPRAASGCEFQSEPQSEPVFQPKPGSTSEHTRQRGQRGRKRISERTSSDVPTTRRNMSRGAFTKSEQGLRRG
jgi:hypothetical protein